MINPLKMLSGGIAGMLDDPKVVEFIVVKGIEWVKDTVKRSQEMEKRIQDLEDKVKLSDSATVRAIELAKRAQQEVVAMLDRLDQLEKQAQRKGGA